MTHTSVDLNHIVTDLNSFHTTKIEGCSLFIPFTYPCMALGRSDQLYIAVSDYFLDMPKSILTSALDTFMTCCDKGTYPIYPDWDPLVRNHIDGMFFMDSAITFARRVMQDGEGWMQRRAEYREALGSLLDLGFLDEFTGEQLRTTLVYTYTDGTRSAGSDSIVFSPTYRRLFVPDTLLVDSDAFCTTVYAALDMAFGKRPAPMTNATTKWRTCARVLAGSADGGAKLYRRTVEPMMRNYLNVPVQDTLMFI